MQFVWRKNSEIIIYSQKKYLKSILNTIVDYLLPKSEYLVE